MTLQQFIESDLREQQKVVVSGGLKLGERIQPDFKYEIYQLENFYVELKIVNDDGGQVVGLQTFENLDQLDPYLHLMNTDNKE